MVLAVLLACTLGTAISTTAQEERPQITPGERKVPRKKDAGPRAVGLLQMAADGKTSIVPIAILVYGKFWDASAYKADPVPMALDSGTVYEAERTGNSLGLFTVGSALKRNNGASGQPPWIGTGAWRPIGTETATKGVKAEAIPVGIDKSDEPPRLTRDTAVDSTKAKAPASAASAPASSSVPASSAPAGKSDSDEPPRLMKPSAPSEPAAGSAPAGSSEPAPGAPPASADAKPAEMKAPDTKPEAGPNLPASDSGASAGSRPRLRRGMPVAPVDEEVPGYSKPGAKAAASSKLAETAAAKSEIKLVPAISDASGPQPKSYTFEWLKGEEGDRRKQMVDLAKDQLRTYVAARAKGNVTAKVAHPARSAAKSGEPILENVQMVAYDLWGSNVPVILLSAEAHMPPPPAGATHSEATDLQYSIFLVAYPDIYGNLRKLHVGITDKFHLDVTPRLDLIDALDADGDGRGELLFRETSDQGSGWVIYRATADKLWKMYDSLRPE